MRKERKILRFGPQKLRKSFANGNPNLGSKSIKTSKLVIYALHTKSKVYLNEKKDYVCIVHESEML